MGLKKRLCWGTGEAINLASLHIGFGKRIIYAIQVHRFGILATLGVVLAACGGVQDPPREEQSGQRVEYRFETQGVVAEAGITIDFEKTADWDSGAGERGFTATVTILNDSGSDLVDWDLSFDFLHSVGQMWNVSYSKTGQRFHIQPEEWNASIQNGQSGSFGLNGAYSGVFQEPGAYVISGMPIGSQDPVASIPVTCELDATFTTTAQWQNGDGSFGFVGEVYVTNVGANPVHWSLRFDMQADIVNMWNATNTKDGNTYYVEPAPWNVRLEPGGTRSFGFQALAPSPATPHNLACLDQFTGTGVLTPGESLEVIDGIVILANSPEFTQPMQVLMEHVESEDLPVPFPSYETPVTPFYRISSDASWNAWSMAGLDVFVPVPEAPEGYRAVAQLLVPTSSLYHPLEEASGLWAKTWVGVDVESSIAHINLRRLDSEGIYFTFTFAKVKEAELDGLRSAANGLRFAAICDFEKFEAIEPPAFTCGDDAITLAEATANLAYETFRSAGFQQGHFKEEEGAYRIWLVPPYGTTTSDGMMVFADGLYLPDTGEIQVATDGVSDLPPTHTLAHEVFHGIQESYLKRTSRWSGVLWVAEGTAIVAAESALNGGEIKRHANRDLRVVDVSLSSSADPHAHLSQDFWVYLAKRLDVIDIRYLIPILEATVGHPDGDPYQRLDAHLRDIPSTPFPEGLGQAWWEWAINQLYTHEVDIGDGVLGPRNTLRLDLIANPEYVSLNEANEPTIEVGSVRPLEAKVFLIELPDGTPASNVQVELAPGSSGYLDVRRFATTIGGKRVLVVMVGNRRPAPANSPDAFDLRFELYDLPVSDQYPLGQGAAYGDPHLRSFDDTNFSLHSVGEFILARSIVDDFEVQARFVEIAGDVSATAAVAMNVDGERIMIRTRDADEIEILIGDGWVFVGEANPNEVVDLYGGGYVSVSGRTVTVRGSKGDLIEVTLMGFTGGDPIGYVRVSVPTARASKLEGLLGDFDGDPSNDLRTRSGQVLVQPTLADLHTVFAESWRIQPAGSLFHYESGESTYTYSDPQAPRAYLSVDDLDPAALQYAEVVCTNAGITITELFENCAFDVAVTGNPAWAEIAAAIDPTVAGLTVSPQFARIRGVDDVVPLTLLLRGASPTDVRWEASRGSIIGSGLEVEFHPPVDGEFGEVYTVTAFLESNPDVRKDILVLFHWCCAS